MILGIDEVGRGPWAGPLVVGAVLWPDNVELKGLTDSKKLSSKKRDILNDEIIKLAADYGVGEVSSKELDSIGLSNALKLATKRAVDKITLSYDQIIIDGTINFLKDTKYVSSVSTLAKADFLIPAVSAASIIAKVKRDKFMIEMSKKYPEYGFESNVGYGTKKHRDAIEKYGVVNLHRLSFAPLKKYRKFEESNDSTIVTTKQKGDKAENLVKDYLIHEGHVILSQNFKTKFYEIDIISVKEKTIYFTEVKYRKNDNFGGAINSINTAKQKQMKYAVESFLGSGKIRAKNINEYTPLLAVGLVEKDFKLKVWFALEA